jgi:antitoxin component YwqK of YwqJK toxin-antitoxin module
VPKSKSNSNNGQKKTGGVAGVNIKTGAFSDGWAGSVIISIFLCSFFGCGIQDGPYREYYANGQLKDEEFYRGGKREGLSRWYYEGGKLKGEATFKNGEQEGWLKDYYENGQLKFEAIYKNGKPDGPFKFYDEKGQLKNEGVFRNGEVERTPRATTKTEG